MSSWFGIVASAGTVAHRITAPMSVGILGPYRLRDVDRLSVRLYRRCMWQHPWLRIQRLIRAILEVRRDEVTRPVMKATLKDAIRERQKIRRAGWFS